MTEATPLSDLFAIKPRFCRSVNITADSNNPEALAGYVVTPLARSVLRRVAEGLRPTSRERAWSITGPYGAGKSACALFLAKVLGYPRSVEARQMLQGVDADLYRELCEQIPGFARGGFFVTLMVGSREPIAPAILKGLAQALSSEAFDSPDAKELIGELESLYQGDQLGRQVTVASFSEAIERAARIVRESRPEILGILIVVDELGKLLEHATHNPTNGDVFFLQALAELAARSGDYPIGVLTILHLAFEQYAERLGHLQQREWGKIQGRFADIPFSQSQGEMLNLIGDAVEPAQPQDDLGTVIGEEATLAGELKIGPPEFNPREVTEILARCAPLHPTVALILGRLFQSRMAQNQRSLFAFLASGEAHGLQDYLRCETWSGNGHRPFYRLDQLYDYVVSALGSVLFAHTQGKKWAEIADALDRLPSDCATVDARLVKAIGMLGLLGDQRRLKASRQVLVYALADGSDATADEVQNALARLVDWRIAVYRRHKDAFALWEGSDIDIEEEFPKGLAANDRSASLVDLLETHGYLRPYVAKRHLHETGTLRYFVPWVVDVGDLDRAAAQPFEPADGAIVFVLGTAGVEPDALLQSVIHASETLPPDRRDLVFFAIPRDTAGLREALEEVKAWEWVSANTKELHSDRTAREELRGRLVDAQGRAHELCCKYFDKSSSFKSSLWVRAGHVILFDSPADLSGEISRACDRAYDRAPMIHNELVNRRTLSSAAAAARRTLVERMLGQPGNARLGITGFPPELSMYRSVLERSGLHHQAGGRWGFGPSPGDDPCRVRPVWQGIEDFLETTERGKKRVTELFDALRRPPYGIKDGLLPIFLAAAIIHWDQEVAVYENGTFLPKVDIAAFERLMKAPEIFAIQRYRIGEARSHVFQRYSGLFKPGESDAGGAASLLDAVRPILGFVRQLPPYTTYTRDLSAEAVAVREAISKAREPHRLLFIDLPAALGMDPEEMGQDQGQAEAFVESLRPVLAEVARAYDAMLEQARTQLYDALRLPREMDAARKEIAGRAASLREKVSELRLRSFIMRLGANGPDGEWLESVLSLVVNKMPKQWNDQDIPRYGIALTEIAGQFLRVEQVLAENGCAAPQADGTRTVRVGFTAESGEDRSAMVRIAPAEEQDVEDIVEAMQAELGRRARSKRIHDAVIAELVRRVLSQSGQQ